MPTISYNTLDEVPEAFREEAKEDDGKFKVNLVLNSKLTEFRDNNTTLSQDRDDLRSKLASFQKVFGEDSSVDDAVKEIETLRGTAQRVEDGELVENQGLDKAVQERTTKMKETYENQLADARRELNAHKERTSAAEAKYQRSVIDRAITDAAMREDSAVNPSALPDLLRRAHDIYTVGEGEKLVAKQGDVTLYGEDGTTPLQPGEWLQTLRESNSHLFKQSAGGGSGGGDKNLGGLSKADFEKLSPQQKLSLANKNRK